MPLIKTHAKISSDARCLNFGLSFIYSHNLCVKAVLARLVRLTRTITDCLSESFKVLSDVCFAKENFLIMFLFGVSDSFFVNLIVLFAG